MPGDPARSTGPIWSRQHRSTWARTRPRFRPSPPLTTWVQKVSPGFAPDFFTLAGWLCAELFVDALRKAGTDPSRGSLLQALRKITAFDSGNLTPVSNPADKVPITCYLLGQIANGTFQRLDDPPVTGPTHGFRCDGTYYRAN